MKAKKDNSLFSYYGFTKRDAKKYPVISGILKQLTPERIKKEIQEIQKVELPKNLRKCVEEYNKVGSRHPFIWKCMYKFASYGTLPSVAKKYQKSTYEAKLMGMLFVALADDLADKYKDKKLLEEILKIPFNNYFKINKNFSSDEKQYLKSSQIIWNSLQKEIMSYPYYIKFKDLFEFDYKQVFNSIRYGYLLNTNPYFVNLKEAYFYLPYNMQVLVNCSIDLMCSPKFNVNELKILREMVHNAQIMCRIANCLGTWERELVENDFSSSIFIYAIENNIVALDELRKGNREKIKKKINSSNCKNYFLSKWQAHYKEVERLNKKIKTINGFEYIEGLKKILEMYNIGQGLI